MTDTVESVGVSVKLARENLKLLAEINRLRAKKQWIIEERDRTFALMLARAEKAEADNERRRAALQKIADRSDYQLPSAQHIARAALEGTA